jgi:DNA-binding XRE family transcriptional regulator
MTPISKTTFKDWQKEQLKDPEFATIARELEPGYQIARLRIAHGLTQAQLAEMVGTHQPSIARLENGKSLPSLLFLERVASVLNARVEVHILPM